MTDDKVLTAIVELVRKAAADARSNAGYSGSWDDGGASRMERDIEFYLMGRSGLIPPDWKKYQKLLDPEYKEYLRLKNKFEQEE